MQPPVVQDYGTVYNQLGSVYDPQSSLVNTQMAQLGPQQSAQQASLDQAKVNAFKSIDTSANAKGMLFSGFSPDQQATYTGTKYLPAVANLQASFNNQKNTLQSQLNTINANRVKDTYGTIAAQQKNLDTYNTQQNTNAYRQAQLGLGYARLAQSGSKGGITPYQASQLASQYKVSTKKGGGGYAFTGPNGQINMYQYAAATAGGDPNQTYANMKNLLANGSTSDKGTYNYVNWAENKGQTPAQIMAGLKQNNPYYF